MSPNDLLKHDVIDHAADLGLSAYVLGASISRQQIRYKRAFDPTGVVPFVGVRVIGDQVQLRPNVRGGGAPETPYFPRYRAPIATKWTCYREPLSCAGWPWSSPAGWLAPKCTFQLVWLGRARVFSACTRGRASAVRPKKFNRGLPL